MSDQNMQVSLALAAATGIANQFVRISEHCERHGLSYDAFVTNAVEKALKSGVKRIEPPKEKPSPNFCAVKIGEIPEAKRQARFMRTAKKTSIVAQRALEIFKVSRDRNFPINIGLQNFGTILGVGSETARTILNYLERYGLVEVEVNPDKKKWITVTRTAKARNGEFITKPAKTLEAIFKRPFPVSDSEVRRFWANRQLRSGGSVRVTPPMPEDDE
jgi:hypothetical protein